MKIKTKKIIITGVNQGVYSHGSYQFWLLPCQYNTFINKNTVYAHGKVMGVKVY